MISGNEIIKRIKDGSIVIIPFDEKRVNPNSYNITLNNKLKVYTEDILDCKKDNSFKEVIIPEEGIVLQPNELYIGATNEYTETYGLVPCIDGRSSIGRLGICIHVTAGFGDNGFKGVWTLEITVVKPVRIYPNIEIAQIYFQEIEGEKAELYSGRYQNQKEAEVSRFYETRKINDFFLP